MPSVVTDLSQVTPAWLTQALRHSGHLPSGQVTCLRAAPESSYTSTVVRLVVTYSHDAPPLAPPRLFLKLARLDSQQRVVGSTQRRREVEFHNNVAAMMPHAPVARCYQAAYCPETGAAHLLFDDVSETHFGGKSSAPPSRPHCDRAVDAFAALHAFWWDHPALHTIDTFPSQSSAADEIAGIRACFPGFADFAGDHLSMSHRRVYDRVLASLPLLLQRSTRGEHLTLIHGDANLSNVLLPHDAATGTALIIDWQLWGIRFAAEDLANLMALFWNKDQRHSMERGLLMRYYAKLVQFGVKNYTWADCWDDYRLAVIVRVLFMPMWFWHTGAPSSSVWSSLENAMQAFDDLGCLEIL